jgi:glutamyl/glutaminyl-tRNA synthetase
MWHDQDRKPSRREGVPREKMQRLREEWHAEAVAADIEELRRLRHYPIFNRKVLIPYSDLTHAIDDHVEKLTGDRTALHASHHVIG